MRNLKRNPGLWLLAILISFLALVTITSKKHIYEWIFVYYMSYDNDLSPFGKVILHDLERGLTNSKIAVLVQADFADNKGMKRIALYNKNGKPYKKEIMLKSEDSADEGELKKYLQWVRKKWVAKNYCVVFLNHGGTLNHMCLDQKPLRSQSRDKQSGPEKWLHASEAGKLVAGFNRESDGKVRLLFLQQCGRAAIQNLYNFIDASEYIMASPVVVGAPNTYYNPMLSKLAADPNVSGEALAKTIMQEDEHYTMYTLIRNEELRKLPEKLTPVLKSFALVSVPNQPGSCSSLFEYGGEKFYDLKSYFQALSATNNNTGDKELGIFFDWCENRLIAAKSIQESQPPNEPPYCGLSIYVPPNSNAGKQYSFLPLYRETDLELATAGVSE